MHFYFFIILLVFSFESLQAQSCMSKYDFAKIQKLNTLEAKKYLNDFFYTTIVDEFTGKLPSCAEEKIQSSIGIKGVGFDGACYNDYNNYNRLVVYQIKNYSSIFLYECEEECYYDLLNDCEQTLKGQKTGTTEYYDFISYPISEYTLEFREYNKDVTSYIVILYNKGQVQSLLTQQYNKDLQELKRQEEDAKRLTILEEKSDSIANLADSLFANEKYLDAKLKFQEANLILTSNRLKERILKSDEMYCLSFIKTGDKLLFQKLFKEALNSYEKSKDCLNDKRIVEEKIKLVQKEMLNDSIANIVSTANLLFETQNDTLSKLKYIEVKRLDPNNMLASQRIKEIDNLIYFLSERKIKTYDYAQLESKNIENNKSLIEKHLINYISPIKSGNLSIHIHYNFDTLGLNKSSFTIDGAYAGKYKPSFDILSTQFKMIAPVKSGYFVNASTQNHYQISWNTSNAKYKISRNGIKHKSGFEEDAGSITKYLSNYKTNYKTSGTYTIESKNTQVNGDSFYNLQVKSYRANDGPTNVIYSMIVPGLGTKRVTFGEKGTGRMISFFISGALAYGAKYYSNKQYDLYLNSLNNESLYEKANSANKVFITLLGLTSTIYIYDFFFVIRQGFKNMKKSKLINSQIQELTPIKSIDLKLKN